MPQRTTIDPEAVLPAAIGTIPSAIALATGHPRIAAGLLALPAGLIAFFRDPARRVDTTPVDEDTVLAPADGKVMYAGPAQPEVTPPADPIQGEWQQVSIFLSVFDVHINRAPYGGTVEKISYRPGKWLAAYKFESAFENERSDIEVARVVRGEVRRYVFRQVVGLVARRVVTRVRAGDEISSGQRIGLMKFGSRMDIFLPYDVELTVAAGERTVAGESVIGHWRSSEPAVVGA
ncbi:phosphatidylserine decarboxylase [Nocardioides sp. AE5]|uniref:phosphatidylserine decarboxylase n=1 Tax=Nocardioides sp. AE5 TaxID=2962573 RepID=UPI00288142C5|nr:phosphatidylserine decarboxylase [Nocardioides sp. AE5]MDT0200369.1 phosphatidylserine decarboxylase [Nocardioides sp. AE5]